MTPLRAYPAVADAWGPLAAYLGDRFDPALTDPEVLRPFLDREWARLRPHFYRHSVGYLYDLTLFHYSGAKDGFFQTIIDFTAEQGLASIADVGCGIGLDAQALLRRGYDLDAYDLRNPSLAYARWRLSEEHGAGDRVLELSKLGERHYELAYAVDVLGHASDPAVLIDRLFSIADYVAVNMLPHDARHRFGSADLHPGLDHAQILPLFNSRGDLVRLAVSGENTVSIWRKRCR